MTIACVRTKYLGLPSQKELQQSFEYEPGSGRLFRIGYSKHRGVSSKITRRECVTNTPQGYCVVRYRNKLYKAHRIIWCLMTGADPGILQIDHIDRNPANNKWSNLRLADCYQQAANRRARSDSTTRLRGVVRFRDRFQAKIQRRGPRIHLGTFSSAVQAHKAYEQAGQNV